MQVWWLQASRDMAIKWLVHSKGSSWGSGPSSPGTQCSQQRTGERGALPAQKAGPQKITPAGSRPLQSSAVVPRSPASSPGWSERGTPVALLGNETAFKEMHLFIRIFLLRLLLTWAAHLADELPTTAKLNLHHWDSCV